MSSEAADKAECESELANSLVSFESTLKPSDEFHHILELLYTYDKNETTISKKQMKKMEKKLDQLYYRVTKLRNTTLNDSIALAYSYQLVYYSYFSTNVEAHVAVATTYILRCFALVKDKELDPKFILITLQAYYDLGSICLRQSNTDEAMKIFHEGILLYETYIQEIEKCGDPVDFENIIMELPLKGYVKLKLIYINILQSLINVNNVKGSTDTHNIQTYIHLILAAQLGILEIAECYGWIIKALLLCDYLLKYDRFAEARSHITTALYVKEVLIHEIYDKTKEKKSDSVETHWYKKIEELTLTLNAYWVLYGVTFLRRSTERLLRLEKDGDAEINNLNLNYLTISEKCVPQRSLLFTEIERNSPFPHKYKSTIVKYISDYNSAYKTFTDILSNFCSVSSNLNQNIITYKYMDLILDVTKAYKYMVFYEKDRSRRILLQNRIVDLLSDTVKKYEYKTQPNLLRHLHLQLAISHSTLLDAKHEDFETMHPLYIPQRYNSLVLETENLVMNIYMNLQLYLQSLQYDG